jgi:hypothetical protein
VIWGLLIATAAAQSTCADLSAPERDRLSVAWVSPMGRSVGRKAHLTVVPTAELRKWAEAEAADVARTLQVLGLRRAADAPSTAWKVTVFDVAAADLCRPLAAGEGLAAGVAVCSTADRHVPGRYDGSGCTLDLADATPGLQVYSLTWEVAAAQGFCVLPMTRFLTGR